MSEANEVSVNRLVGFRYLREACGHQSQNPTVCYHSDNPGHRGQFGGGHCVKAKCPVWAAIAKANKEVFQ